MGQRQLKCEPWRDFEAWAKSEAVIAGPRGAGGLKDEPEARRGAAARGAVLDPGGSGANAPPWGLGRGVCAAAVAGRRIPAAGKVGTHTTFLDAGNNVRAKKWC